MTTFPSEVRAWTPLHPGDKIAIISPATEIRPAYIDGAVRELRRRGYIPVEMPHARGHEEGTYAASDSARLADLKESLADNEIKGILCGRGGYGTIHLLSEELERIIRENPKPLIGFSDISALHALWRNAGVASIHSSMAKQLTLYNDFCTGSDSPKDAVTRDEIPNGKEMEQIRFATDTLFSMLQFPREKIEYASPSFPGSIEGEAEGEIIGGNLAVLNGLASTPWDILNPEFLKGKILFLEDVGEKIYQIERMLKRLQLCGALNNVAGLIFGHFTDYRPDRNFPSMEAMILSRIREWGLLCPVALKFPVGHTSDNMPIPEGGFARLRVSDGISRLEVEI